MEIRSDRANGHEPVGGMLGVLETPLESGYRSAGEGVVTSLFLRCRKTSRRRRARSTAASRRAPWDRGGLSESFLERS